jgi:hypothetical protein
MQSPAANGCQPLDQSAAWRLLFIGLRPDRIRLLSPQNRRDLYRPHGDRSFS